MSLGARYQCHVCDGYLEGGTERSRCKCADPPDEKNPPELRPENKDKWRDE